MKIVRQDLRFCLRSCIVVYSPVFFRGFLFLTDAVYRTAVICTLNLSPSALRQRCKADFAHRVQAEWSKALENGFYVQTRYTVTGMLSQIAWCLKKEEV